MIADSELMDLLCKPKTPPSSRLGRGQDSDKNQFQGTSTQVLNKEKNPAHTALVIPQIKKGSPLPMTVLGVGGEPVIIEDPVRFRKNIQAMVMAQMMSGYISNEDYEDIINSGSMIEIATIKQMRKAADGDLKAYEYVMDRVLGKPINQTNSVNLNVSYEDLISELDPDEQIVPDDIIDVSVIGKK